MGRPAVVPELDRTRAARIDRANMAAVVAVRTAVNLAVGACPAQDVPRRHRRAGGQRLAARMTRQAILAREEPAAPIAWFLVDEAVLRRCTGTAEIMGHQQVGDRLPGISRDR
jgi:hypothetical protein